MTKTSKFLTILVTVFSIAYMGIAFMMWVVHVDWKEKATKEFPKSEIARQATQIQELKEQIENTVKFHDLAKKGIEADSVAFTAPEIGREARLEAEWALLNAEVTRVAQAVEEEAKKVQAKQDEDKRLREDVQRLMSQYQEIVEHRLDFEANVKRQRDLLFQARGVLQRLQLRAKLLDEEEGKSPSDDDESTASLNRSRNTLNK
jgi:hypothetical protein